MKPTPKLFGALFVAMAVVCAATLVTAAVRLSAADKKVSQLGDDLDHARLELRSSREEADIADGQNAEALRTAREHIATTSPQDLARGLTDIYFDLPMYSCDGGDDNCDRDKRVAVSLQLSRCSSGTPFCVAGSRWISGFYALTLNGDTWSARGTAVNGRAACFAVPTSGAAWAFTAQVTGAQYSISGGWKVTKAYITFSATIPATSCSATTIWWKGTVPLR
ncbi:hypothetical protein GCM10009827_108800 [Dactylosporangium maewongense]|uniref:Secreted protein n=1 Tax=Dactylosporangium maewongense TaxID=634393 RepID=A0ABP4NWI5_9ACTN